MEANKQTDCGVEMQLLQNINFESTTVNLKEQNIYQNDFKM